MDLRGDRLRTYKNMVVHSSKTPEHHQRIKHLLIGTYGAARGLLPPSQYTVKISVLH